MLWFSIFSFRTLWLRLTSFGVTGKSIMLHINRLTSNSPISTHKNNSKKTKEHRLNYVTINDYCRRYRKPHASNFVLERLCPFSIPRKFTKIPCRRLECTVEMTRFALAQMHHNQWRGPYKNNLYHNYRYRYYLFTIHRVNAICSDMTSALRRGLNNRISVGGARRYCHWPHPQYNPSVRTTAFRNG